MKKIVAILSIAFSLLATQSKAQAAPLYPFGAPSTITSITASGGTVAITANNSLVYVSSIPTLTAALNLSVTAGSKVKPGALLFVVIKTNGSEVTTFSGAVTSPTVAGSAGKTWSQGFMYTGSKYYPIGTKQQVD